MNYIKKAFTNQWNLLLFAGGCGFALLSGRPDIGLPLVFAVEAAYLGLLGTHPKFRSYVDSQSAKVKRNQHSEQNQQILKRIQTSLPPELYDRYLSLRQRCLQLGAIANDLQSHGATGGAHDDLATQQSRGLDRLLWVYLRLLFSSHSLVRFFDTVSEQQIEKDLQRVESQLGELDASGETDDHVQKLRRTLLDSQSTLKERLDNYRRAESNSEFVSAELDRVENKIKSLTELSVNRQDPDFISGQIDEAAQSIRATEVTMNDLRFITGIGTLDDEAPELMRSDDRFVIE